MRRRTTTNTQTETNPSTLPNRDVVQNRSDVGTQTTRIYSIRDFSMSVLSSMQIPEHNSLSFHRIKLESKNH